jgi:hypothetical protein
MRCSSEPLEQISSFYRSAGGKSSVIRRRVALLVQSEQCLIKRLLANVSLVRHTEGAAE